MGSQRRGRVKIPPGPWSQAVAREMARIVDARPGKRDQFQTEAGFSGRLAKLLNGEQAWYLEDVERACAALGLDVVAFLGTLDVDVRRRPQEPEGYDLAALDEGDGPQGDPDDGYNA